jgi:ABC-2 type transport system permease protein
VIASSAADRRFRFSPAPYIEFAKVAFAREATYRFEVFTSIGSLLVRVYLFRMVWTALYLHNAGLRALTLEQAITYSTVALLMSLVMDIDQTRLIVEKLDDGSIATDFMKPINVPLYFFSDGTGEVGFHAVLILPSLLLALLIVHIQVPSAATLVVFFVTFFLGYMVGLLMNFMLNCIAFWTLEIHAVQLIVTWITDLLGGEIIPLVFFPAAVQSVIFVLPFAAMYSTPLLIYVGTIGPDRYAEAIALQLFWIAVFGIISIFMWRAGSQRVVVQGG